MRSLAEIDVVENGKGIGQCVLIQLGFGMGCAIAAIGLRALVDLWAPTAGPFAFVYPTVLIATLFGRALAGIAAYIASFLWAWWYVLPVSHSFRFEVATDPSRVLINACCALVLLLLAEEFRRAVREASRERDREIEHRTKNNFALVASLLSLQARRHDDPDVKAALQEAIGRIRTFAEAYENLALTDAPTGEMPLHDYIRDVVARIARAMLPERVRVEIEADEALLPSQVAVAIGLFLNEALTNCTKYAYPGEASGTIRVRFEHDHSGWKIAVIDDGVGAGPEQPAGTGLGQSLMHAFAQQAGASFLCRKNPRGFEAMLSSRPGEIDSEGMAWAAMA